MLNAEKIEIAKPRGLRRVLAASRKAFRLWAVVVLRQAASLLVRAHRASRASRKALWTLTLATRTRVRAGVTKTNKALASAKRGLQTLAAAIICRVSAAASQLWRIPRSLNRLRRALVCRATNLLSAYVLIYLLYPKCLSGHDWMHNGSSPDWARCLRCRAYQTCPPNCHHEPVGMRVKRRHFSDLAELTSELQAKAPRSIL